MNQKKYSAEDSVPVNINVVHALYPVVPITQAKIHNKHLNFGFLYKVFSRLEEYDPVLYGSYVERAKNKQTFEAATIDLFSWIVVLVEYRARNHTVFTKSSIGLCRKNKEMMLETNLTKLSAHLLQYYNSEFLDALQRDGVLIAAGCWRETELKKNKDSFMLLSDSVASLYLLK